ncbi:MAG: uracil phosphoribosyltransferase [Bacteroidia bacterium]|jgi:uracil phosphoribosyltransferase
MEIHVLSQSHSLINQFISELRDVHMQKDRMRFRKNIERIGQIMAYEVSKTLTYTKRNVITPLGTHQSDVLAEQPVLATILRAGLSMHLGVLNYFDQADCAFISAFRKHQTGNQFEIVVEYLASPDLTGKTLFLIDPMLATGQSIDLTYQAILQHGTPSKLHILSLLASQDGIDYLSNRLPHATCWIGDLDPELNKDSYILPGLGDAGDLSFGEKL